MSSFFDRAGHSSSVREASTDAFVGTRLYRIRDRLSRLTARHQRQSARAVYVRQLPSIRDRSWRTSTKKNKRDEIRFSFNVSRSGGTTYIFGRIVLERFVALVGAKAAQSMAA